MQWPCFQIKSHLKVTGDELFSIWIWEGHSSIPNSTRLPRFLTYSEAESKSVFCFLYKMRKQRSEFIFLRWSNSLRAENYTRRLLLCCTHEVRHYLHRVVSWNVTAFYSVQHRRLVLEETQREERCVLQLPKVEENQSTTLHTSLMFPSYTVGCPC